MTDKRRTMLNRPMEPLPLTAGENAAVFTALSIVLSDPHLTGMDPIVRECMEDALEKVKHAKRAGDGEG